MSRKLNRFLAFLLTLALVTTTFSSDYASTRSFAVGSEEELEQISEDSNEESSELQWEDIETDEETPAENEENESDIEADVETETEASEGTPSDQATEGAVEEATADITNGGNVVEEPATAPAATEATASATEAVEASTEATSANVESTEAASAATSASIEEAADAASSASTEIEEKEQNLVTVKYKASMGGRVSVKEETVDLNDEDAKFEGSEATPWNDKYQFTEWVDEDGNFVTNDALLVPSDVEKDTTFTAKFMKLEEMPEITESKITGGMSVLVEAEEGLFPEGTTVSIEAIPETQALETAQDTLGDNVKEAKGVDIKFIYNKEEIQPADAQYVHVSISLVDKIEGTDFTVLHQHDGEVKEIEATVATEEKNEDPEDETKVATGVELDSNEFSVFIVAAQDSTGNDARLNVKFMNGTTEIYSAYVKKSDLVKGSDNIVHFNDIIYDPGVGETDPGVQFRGWTQNADYTTKTEEKSIADVRDEIKDMLNSGVAEGETVTYYAMLFKTYTVSYLDDRGASLGSSEIKFRADDNDGYQDYHVYMHYTASDENHNFEGWHVSEGKDNIKDYDYSANDGEGKLYANGADIKIKGDVTFSAIEAEGHWLVFNENGKGATYNAPQFVKSGKPTVEPCEPEEMIRLGYTFGGWYDTEAHANAHAQNTNVTIGKFTFGSTISEKTTIYASWISATTANYTILLWRQNVDGQSYDFAEALTFNGTVGSTINAVSVRGTGNNKYVRIGTKDYNGDDYKGFHYDRDDQSGKTIAPEGTTVVNVYYNRNEHTLKFQVWKGIIIIGSYTTIKEIKALYGQSISDQFPIVGTDGVTYTAARWDPQSSTPYNQVLSYIDIMPDADVTFHRDTDGPGTFRTINYYVEALPGETGETVSYEGKSFVLYKSLDCDYNWFTEAEDYIELPGFSKYGVVSYNSNGNKVDKNWKNGNVKTLNCFYTRNKYTINYMDGAYFDGNGKAIESETNVGRLHQKTNIYYLDDISTINYEPSPTHAGYVFECWCVDSACTTEYTFGTMPEGGITVYAKWRQIQYRVFLHPNAGTDPTLDWGSESQAMSFRISYGGKVSVPTGRRTSGYEFRGWYLDPEFKNGFDAESFVLNETTVTDDSYDKTVDFTDPMDKWGNFVENQTKSNADVDRPWITKKLDLYAQWRGTLDGATGIGIIYDANGGNPAPNDTNLYGDKAWAAAGAAPTTTPAITEGEGENAKTYESRFSHWVVQKWNDTTKKFEDTNVTVLPGATFQVLKDDARVQDLDEEHSSETEKKSYTIQLRAQYVKVEKPTPTHITWYDNFGGKYRDDTDLEVNKAVPVFGLGDDESIPEKHGYIFKGWARDVESVGTTTTNTSPLFITYDPSVYSDNKGYNHAQVAADEKEPYHALYAVWEEDPDATYSVTYVADPATMGDVTTKENKDIQVLVTTGVTGSKAEAKPGYKFTGWYNGTELASDDAELTAAEAIAKLNKEGAVYKNTTFTAKFEVDAGQTYTVSYESNDTKMGTVTNAKDEGIQVLGTDGINGSTAQKKAGYKFTGWYK
ncbi:Listeria/Bacterioides repeat-containing protein, partial [Butyrivibrio sp. Su6]|uniref:InlB B-repeat-containing protein n=1 Tax=Butyrivibrio sp. Su6 TaxID=1520810 RepID=UPI00089F6FEC